ncbi:MAG: Bardet-Biedl syndrome 5 protein, partial [Methanosarcinales archaeon]
GERGSLAITNLRMIWQAHKSARTNLSIGYAAIQNLTIRTTESRLRGMAQALTVMTRLGTNRFEFIFTSLVKASPRLFTTVQAVFRAYETSRLYRDLKLRGAVVRDKVLMQLPQERIFSRVEGVWNLSSDQGNLGVFYISNVRIVWHAALAENFNVSVPYVQIKSVRLRDSKFGRALVLETSDRSGNYMLGFRVDPADALDAVHKEVVALRATALASPVFGVEFTLEEKPETLEALRVARVFDDGEGVIAGADAAGAGTVDAFAAYFADSNKDTERPLAFHRDLGLAIETPLEGITLEKLWAAT